jgi:hypothetical protein
MDYCEEWNNLKHFMSGMSKWADPKEQYIIKIIQDQMKEMEGNANEQNCDN